MAEQVWHDRPPSQSQFPSKYGHLPDIGPDSARTNPETQLVPLRTRKSSPGGLGQQRTVDYDTEERVRQLEMRLGVSEKSNRALLEEVLRLQSDLKIATKRSEDIIRDERDSRQQLSEAIKISNELITQLSIRIKETEEKIQEEKDSLNSLFSHTKHVEKTVLSSQHDIQSRKDSQSLRLQEMRVDLNETKQSRSQLESITYSLSEELRALRSKFENQQAEFTNTISEIRNRSRKLEEENRLHMESMRKQSESHSVSDINTTHLRGQVEQRLTELRDVLMEVRGKHETEQNERRSLEKATQAKLNDLYTQISEQSRKREEGMHAVDMVMREKDHTSQAEKLQLTAKVTDTVEDLNKRLLAKEMKIREDVQSKYMQLEKLLQREQSSRQDYEKSVREEADRKWQMLKKILEEELIILKDNIGTDKSRSRDTIGKLDQSITIVEKQLSENKKQVDKIISAEIKSRKIHEAGTNEKIMSVNEKLQIATSTLQQAIGGISHNLASNNDKMRRELRQLLNEQQQAGTRALSDMDARMMAVKQRMANMEDVLDAKVASKFQVLSRGRLTNRPHDSTDALMATQATSERMTDRLDAITKWQDTTGDTLRELGRSVQTLPQDIYQMEEKLKLLKSEMDSRVGQESEVRAREVEHLRQELSSIKGRLERQPKPATLQDLEAIDGISQDKEMNMGVRKLADNLQTVKTVLGMKIQSEQKLRISGLEDLQSQLNQIKIMSGSSLKFGSVNKNQFDDLDTGLGWDDLGTVGTTTGTPSSAIGDGSRQKIPTQKQTPIREASREESPFATRGGLKNINTPSPTPKSARDDKPKSPYGANHNGTDRKTPGDVTPDDWKSPSPETKTPNSAQLGRQSKTPVRENTPGNRSTTGDQTQRRGSKAGSVGDNKRESTLEDI